MYIVSIVSKLKDLDKALNGLVDKFTSNPAFAAVVALVLFVFIFIGVSNFTKK